MPFTTGDNNFGVAKWIVNATAGLGTHTTIAAALTSASSGDTIFIMPGTYTENLTMKAGVNLSGWGSDGPGNPQTSTSNVTIAGTVSMTVAGTAVLYGLRLQTNSAALISVTGTAASILTLKNCYLDCTNNSGIIGSSTLGYIKLINCGGDLSGSAINYFTMTNGSNIYIDGGIYRTSGSQVASTWTKGIVTINNCKFSNALTSSGADGGSGTLSNVFITGLGNTTCITQNGVSSSLEIYNCNFVSNSASAVSIGAGATALIYDSNVFSSNTNAITGAGTLNYTNITFSGTSSVINTTTQTPMYTNLGKYKASGQPCFAAYANTANSAANVTGDGTAYTMVFGTEFFDQNSNFDGTSTFTAPVTGRYLLSYSILSQNNLATHTPQAELITTAFTYYLDFGGSFAGNFSLNVSRIVPMTAGDTAIVKISTAGGTKTVGVYGSDTDPRTMFSGYLVA